MAGGTERNLTRREFDAVIRRAAELSSSDPASDEASLSESDLIRIAGEVGLEASHVRRALAELRAEDGGSGLVQRFFGPGVVSASRVVPEPPDAIHRKLDDFLVASQLLQPVRRSPKLLQYRPSLDWASQLARAASLHSRKYFIASARSVEAKLEPVEGGRTFVEITVEPGTRGDAVAGATVGGGFAGGTAGVAAGVGLATVAPLGIAIGVGVAVAGGFFGAIAYATGRSHKRKVMDVQSEIEGVLDALESGLSLEPPPPSWRRWVKRNFHGVARDILAPDE